MSGISGFRPIEKWQNEADANCSIVINEEGVTFKHCHPKINKTPDAEMMARISKCSAFIFTQIDKAIFSEKINNSLEVIAQEDNNFLCSNFGQSPSLPVSLPQRQNIPVSESRQIPQELLREMLERETQPLVTLKPLQLPGCESLIRSSLQVPRFEEIFLAANGRFRHLIFVYSKEENCLKLNHSHGEYKTVGSRPIEQLKKIIERLEDCIKQQKSEMGNYSQFGKHIEIAIEKEEEKLMSLKRRCIKLQSQASPPAAIPVSISISRNEVSNRDVFQSSECVFEKSQGLMVPYQDGRISSSRKRKEMEIKEGNEGEKEQNANEQSFKKVHLE